MVYRSESYCFATTGWWSFFSLKVNFDDFLSTTDLSVAGLKPLGNDRFFSKSQFRWCSLSSWKNQRRQPGLVPRHCIIVTLVLVYVFCDVRERVSGRGIEGRMRQERRLIKSFISQSILNQIPQNVGRETCSFYLDNRKNLHQTEVRKTTLGGFEPMRAIIFRSVVQRGINEPAIAAAQTTANLCNLYDARDNVINTVASPDSKGLIKLGNCSIDLGP